MQSDSTWNMKALHIKCLIAGIQLHGNYFKFSQNAIKYLGEMTK